VTPFRDLETVTRTFDRLHQLTGLDIASRLPTLLTDSPDPDASVLNFESWLRSVASPRLLAEECLEQPALGRQLLLILGASTPIANLLSQNPELASIVFDPGERSRLPEREAVVREGRQLLAASSSYSHSLDRLRFLRQRWLIPIVLADLGESATQERIWQALSDLADAILELIVPVVWAQSGGEGPCPVAIAAYGKHGGREVNYSSDLDLVYILADGADESIATRFCAALGRAISDPMGRGFLYRIDLRLRPYGASGPIAPTYRAVENYYRLYAEPWEVQALMRSRIVVGTESDCERWEAMRVAHCFRPAWAEPAIEHMLDMRQRIDHHAVPEDFKRARGGIRDIEFRTQIGQLLHGHKHPEVRVTGCLPALRALDAIGAIDHAVAASLMSAYEFLRRLEHRVQLLDERQTHELPSDPRRRETVARLMDAAGFHELESKVADVRRSVDWMYRSAMGEFEAKESVRESVLARAGAEAVTVAHWFDGVPEPEAFYTALHENRDSLHRVVELSRKAPALVAQLRGSIELTESVLSGEIEEADSRRVNRGSFAKVWTARLARWTLAPDPELGPDLAAILDALALDLAQSAELNAAIFALGSQANLEPGPNSDLDLLFLVPELSQQQAAESAAQRFVRAVQEMRRHGVDIKADFRLRPEGGKGLLARTYHGLQTYGDTAMETWERFALGHARQLAGPPEATAIVRSVAYDRPLDLDRLMELMKMKRRIETERVSPTQVHRHVKLGAGGLNDLEWLVHLHEMRDPSLLTASDIPSRLRSLLSAGILNAVEFEACTESHGFLYELRSRMCLLGIQDDVIPENPIRLEALADSIGMPNGNALLARHSELSSATRMIYLETVERLKR